MKTLAAARGPRTSSGVVEGLAPAEVAGDNRVADVATPAPGRDEEAAAGGRGAVAGDGAGNGRQ